MLSFARMGGGIVAVAVFSSVMMSGVGMAGNKERLQAVRAEGGVEAAVPEEGDRAAGRVIVDSRMSFAEAVAGTRAPPETIAALCLVEVRYYSFDGLLHQGQLVVNRAVRQDVSEIFKLIETMRFPVAKAVPIVAYRWSDGASMRDNNSSAFNYRTVAGTKRLSRPALGLAVDINPFLNPVVYEDGRVSPRGAVYRPGDPGVLTREHPVVREFLRRGWQWGADFKSMRDYHHFDYDLSR